MTWLKIETNTPDKPEVLLMGKILNTDIDAITGKLVRFWAWIDANCVDGFVSTPVDVCELHVDRLCRLQGFFNALVSVNWVFLAEDGSGFYVNNFDYHNGESAKKRALKTRRQANWRANKEAKNETVKTIKSVDGVASTREEKRREDIKDILGDSGETPQKTPFNEIVSLYHKKLPELRNVIKLTKTRKQQINARWHNELDSIEEWEAYFDIVKSCSFLIGENNNQWQADFDFLIKQANVIKICEGRYVNRKAS